MDEGKAKRLSGRQRAHEGASRSRKALSHAKKGDVKSLDAAVKELSQLHQAVHKTIRKECDRKKDKDLIAVLEGYNHVINDAKKQLYKDGAHRPEDPEALAGDRRESAGAQSDRRYLWLVGGFPRQLGKPVLPKNSIAEAPNQRRRPFPHFLRQCDPYKRKGSWLKPDANLTDRKRADADHKSSRQYGKANDNLCRHASTKFEVTCSPLVNSLAAHRAPELRGQAIRNRLKRSRFAPAHFGEPLVTPHDVMAKVFLIGPF